MMDPSEMIEIPFAEFEKDFDAYMDRIEAGETFIVRKPDGTAVVAAPITEELEPLLDIMPEMPYNGEVDEELSV